MKLQTKIPLKEQTHNQIDYKSKLLLLGSCFSENIGEKFEYFKFQSIQNPFGILYHPKAIEKLFINALNEKEYDETDVFYLNERWHCFDAHSNLSNVSKKQLIRNLNHAIDITNKKINESSHIIITLGTAWSYRFIEEDKIVANCHKVPQKKFLKEIQSVNSIIESLESIFTLAKSVNPKVTVILTVSPVRHLKDGFVGNTQSKSHLIAAINQVVNPRHNIHYFPSYEIMMDELRDYRFYGDDMIHPNQIAIDYIWNYFKKVWLATETKEPMLQIDAIQKAMKHRPFNLKSEEHKAFLKDVERKKKELISKFSHIIF